jgi:heat shock protein HtpX
VTPTRSRVPSNDYTARVAPVDVSPGTASLFIVNPFGALDTMARWFSTHPPIEERVARLRGMTTQRRRMSWRAA